MIVLVIVLLVSVVQHSWFDVIQTVAASVVAGFAFVPYVSAFLSFSVSACRDAAFVAVKFL